MRKKEDNFEGKESDNLLKREMKINSSGKKICQ